ncbi:MAG: hypothetical protein K2Y29_20890, partial [Beijerinckiaceae bacterium]|nr:hypothetical protein [Beijerinckiaceae bacterium]
MPRSFREASYPARGTSSGGTSQSPSQVTMRRGVFLAMTGMLLAFGACTAASAAYLLLRDQALQALGSRQAKVERTYEEHVASLRRELEKVNSQRLLEGAAMDARVRELSIRQAQIESRALMLAALAVGETQAQTSKTPRTAPLASTPAPAPVAPAAPAALGFAPPPRAPG